MTNLEVVKTLYKCFVAGDFERFKTLCDPEIVWQQAKGFPGGGHYVGADQVIEKVFTPFAEQWSSWKYEIDEYLNAGDTIVVVGRYLGTHKASGKSFTAEAVHLYRVESGKILTFRQFADTKIICDATS